MISFAFFSCEGRGGGGETNRGDNGTGDRVVGRAGLYCPCSEPTMVFGKTGLVFNGGCRDGHFAYW